MPIVEFIGIARAGKSTTAKYLETNIPGFTYYPERHDLVPKEVWGDDFTYHSWYAKYCVETLKEALEKPGIHLFERGVIDHIIMGKAYFKMGWFTKKQLDEYLALLNPYIDDIDKVFVFRIPVEVSVQRAKETGKDVTRAIPYITTLYEEYGKIKDWFPSAIYLPEDASLKDLLTRAELAIKELVKPL